MFNVVTKDWEALLNSWMKEEEDIKEICKKLSRDVVDLKDSFCKALEEFSINAFLESYKNNKKDVWLYEDWTTVSKFKLNEKLDKKKLLEDGKLVFDSREICIVDLGYNHVIEKIEIDKDDWNSLKEALRYLSVKWNIARMKGLVSDDMGSFLGVNEIKNEMRINKDSDWAKYPEIAEKIYNKLNEKFLELREKVTHIMQSGGDIWSCYEEWAGKRNKNRKMVSMLAHLVYPNLFPIFYETTKQGYSQTKGLKKLTRMFLAKLLDDHSRNKADKLVDCLKLQEYEWYSRVYRLLLYLFFECFREKLSSLHFDIFTQFLADIEMIRDPMRLLENQKAIILYGVPGTSKTHYAIYGLAKEVIKKNKCPHCKKFYESDNKSNLCEEHVEIVQFHPSYQYSDFVIGIKPEVSGDKVVYKVVPGKFYRMCARAAAKSNERFVLIIDEINRANLTEVFGELLYCLEYRNKNVKLQLTYKNEFSGEELGGDIEDQFKGGDKFFVPENLYIIGTMNHADRSLSGIDMAIRRRFAWYKMDYSEGVLKEMIEKEVKEKQNYISNLEEYIKRCSDLNDFIESSPEDREGKPEGLNIDDKNKNRLKYIPLNKDHKIGHAYFAKILDFLPFNSGTNIKVKILSDHLEALWVYYIQPLLEDYLGVEYAEYSDIIGELKVWFCKEL